VPVDLAVIIVSTNEARWLSASLSSLFEHLGDITADVVVVDNDSIDGTRELVETEFPHARVVSSQNLGFGHANNQGFATTSSRYVLFLNPDTEILDGTFEEVIADLDDRIDVGLVGVRQVAADGKLFPTIRRFPTLPRYFFEALSSERFPFRASWLGERELDMSVYEHDVACDWTSGSFMLARREALESAGGFDERFFIFSEEVDLCLRIRQAGWDIRHVPTMTILHHFNKVGVSSRILSQDAFARKQYMVKHFRQPKRFACLSALYLRHMLRALPIGGDRAHAEARSSAAREALRVLRHTTPPPFGGPPPTAVANRRLHRSSSEDAERPPATPHRG
jgi:N-acetylglucosaminyl-diphospho-decaprenol L-rhamnosyltransferase